MKITSKKIASGAIAALCLTLGSGLRAADTAYDVNKARGERETKYETKSTEGMPAKFNKASGIIGMDVRNHKDERLGEIKDVVFDLKSERVAYAVLGTGGLLDRQKLLAVPLNAFTASADQKYLILRAEKSKLEAAMGIEREHWPSVTNPSWGAEPFWEKTTELFKAPDTTPKPETPPATPPDIK
jgi:sporulation protein YlmC with PRC-barrel domain